MLFDPERPELAWIDSPITQGLSSLLRVVGWVTVVASSAGLVTALVVLLIMAWR